MSLYSMERSLTFCQVFQRRSNLVLPLMEIVTDVTLTGFGFIELYFVDLRYRTTSIWWLEDPSKSLLSPLVSAQIFPVAACRELSCGVMDSSSNSTL